MNRDREQVRVLGIILDSHLSFDNHIGLCFHTKQVRLLQQLQLIQNAAARILTGTFQILLLVHKALDGLAPQFISDLLTVYNSVRPLLSPGSDLLNVPEPHLSVLKVLSVIVVLVFGTW